MPHLPPTPRARGDSCHQSQQGARHSQFGLGEREVRLVIEHGYNNTKIRISIDWYVTNNGLLC